MKCVSDVVTSIREMRPFFHDTHGEQDFSLFRTISIPAIFSRHAQELLCNH